MCTLSIRNIFQRLVETDVQLCLRKNKIFSFASQYELPQSIPRAWKSKSITRVSHEQMWGMFECLSEIFHYFLLCGNAMTNETYLLLQYIVLLEYFASDK